MTTTLYESVNHGEQRIRPVFSSRRIAHRILLGPTNDPSWARPSFIALLIATAVAYLWNLSSNGWGNEFYAAAVQAGTESWKAFLFGSADASNAITVDKTPGSLWVMELSGRLLGFSSFSMLLPNALMGVGSVALVYAAIKRWFSAGPALLAGWILALTPVAALMFRFNNPDATLVFALCVGGYFITRAIEAASTKWLVATGAALGFAFLAKEMQAFLVVPGFGLAYLVCAPTNLRRRIGQLLVGLAAMLVTCGWWIALVTLWPAASRPYVGGSAKNSILDIIFEYNGIGRLTGNSAGNGGGGGGGMNFSGSTGWLRMFNDLVGGQISWLLPAALICLVAGAVMCRRTKRTNLALAGLIIWGGWLLMTALTLSFASGTIHTYYTVALAPAIAAVIGMVASRLWTVRQSLFARVTLAITVLTTGVWAFALLSRTSDWLPWLRYFVLAATAFAVLALLAESWLTNVKRRFGVAVAALCLVASLSGPAAYAVQTIDTVHTGSVPSAGPSTGSAMGMGGGFGGGSTDSVSSEVVALLQANASNYTWVAAAQGSMSSAPYQLASGVPVMSIGGFNGSDPYPSLDAFKALVSAGKIHYYIAGGSGLGGGRSGDGTTGSISSWVTSNFKSVTVGGVTLYDLTNATASSTTTTSAN